MPKQFATEFAVSALSIVESLAPDERKTGRYLYDDLLAFCVAKNIGISFNAIETAAEFRGVMKALARHARDDGLRPILHLDIHGLDDRRGLLFLPSRDRLSWTEFASLTRQLNEATANNLMVVMAVCHGFRAVLEVKVAEPSPFCFLLGPEGEVTNQQVLASFGSFYRSLFEASDVEEAYEHLPYPYRHFTCEELLVNSFARYFGESCVGGGRRRRVESLITQARQQAHQIPLRDIRRFVKTFTRPAPDNFERFRRTFLMAGHPENAARFTVTYNDVLEAIGRGEVPPA